MQDNGQLRLSEAISFGEPKRQSRILNRHKAVFLNHIQIEICEVAGQKFTAHFCMKYCFTGQFEQFQR